MKRENPKRTLTNENVTCPNLNVVFCFSLVGEKFRNSVLQFPGLVSGCTVDCFQAWPKDALVLITEHFLFEFDVECTVEVKKELVNVMGTIQDIVSFSKITQSNSCYPKLYLNFIGGYKNISDRKQRQLA